MAKLEFRLTPEQHEALEESLKQYYVATQDGAFELEGVGSLQRALEAERKRTTKPELMEEVEKLRKFKESVEANEQKAKQADLERQGKYEEALKEQEKAWKERLKTESDEKSRLFADVKRERLTNELVKRGVIPERASYLVGELDADIELSKSDNGYQLRKKGGIGDAAEFDAMIDAAKSRVPFFFAANGASGSGASGNTNNGGQSAKTWTRSQWDSATSEQRAEFSAAKGQVTD